MVFLGIKEEENETEKERLRDTETERLRKRTRNQASRGAKRKHTAPIFSVSGLDGCWKPRSPPKVSIPVWHGPKIQKLRTKAHMSKSQDLQSKR